MLASFMIEPHHTNASNNENQEKHEVIHRIKKDQGVRKVATSLPEVRVDFDIVIEIGYAEEEGQPLTLKQLLLLNLCSRTTVRRKLARLVEQGVIVRRKHANDQRANLLIISPASIKLLSKYGATLTSIAVLHFK